MMGANCERSGKAASSNNAVFCGRRGVPQGELQCLAPRMCRPHPWLDAEAREPRRHCAIFASGSTEWLVLGVALAL